MVSVERIKDVIGWIINDIKGISPIISMHRIILEDESKPSRKPQRRLNPAIKEVLRKEILKLLDPSKVGNFLYDLSNWHKHDTKLMGLS